MTPKLNAWKLYTEKGRYRFTVFFDADMNGIEVKRALLNKGECKHSDYLICDTYTKGGSK